MRPTTPERLAAGWVARYGPCQARNMVVPRRSAASRRIGRDYGRWQFWCRVHELLFRDLAAPFRG